MRPAYFLIICLVAGLALLGTGGTIGYFIGKGKCPDAVRIESMIADSVRTAMIIVERDSIVAQYERDIEALKNRIANRKPINTRVENAKKYLHGATVDSLINILDRPLSEP